MENSKMFNLNWGDIGRGAVVAILAGCALPVLAIMQTPDFNFTMVNWNSVLVLAINGGLAGFAGYISKNFLTADNGKLFGKI